MPCTTSRHIDGLTEVVLAIIQRYGKTGSFMDADLEAQVFALLLLV